MKLRIIFCWANEPSLLFKWAILTLDVLWFIDKYRKRFFFFFEKCGESPNDRILAQSWFIAGTAHLQPHPRPSGGSTFSCVVLTVAIVQQTWIDSPIGMRELLSDGRSRISDVRLYSSLLIAEMISLASSGASSDDDRSYKNVIHNSYPVTE